MKNILFFIGKYPNFGGTERITTLLANQFCQQGFGVTILACESICDISLMGLKEQFEVEKLPAKNPLPNRCIVVFVRNLFQ